MFYNSSLSTWLKAARLRTLPLALSCTFAASALALEAKKFDWIIFVLAICTTILLQVLSNFANDYGDYKNGADQIKGRTDRMMSSGRISEYDMKKGLIITSLLAFCSGIYLLYFSLGLEQLPKFLGMLLLGFGAIWAALKYTAGSNPYGYRGLGDLFVFLFFGMVGVFGTLYLYTQTHTLDALPIALTIGLLSVAVLNLNNMRDIETDQLAGKITIPVRLGLQKAKTYHRVLLFLAWESITYFVMYDFVFLKLIILLPIAIQIKHWIFVEKCTQASLLDGELKKVALSTFLIALLFWALEIYNFFY